MAFIIESLQQSHEIQVMSRSPIYRGRNRGLEGVPRSTWPDKHKLLLLFFFFPATFLLTKANFDRLHFDIPQNSHILPLAEISGSSELTQKIDCC